jgi:hypothetical protein
LFKNSRREVQACCRRGDGTSVAGKDGLIAVAIGIGVVTMDVRRQWRVANRVEHSEEVVNRSEFKKALAELATLEDFGFERDVAVGCGEDKALADGNFAAGTDEGAAAIVADGFDKHDFDTACRLFTIPDQCALRVEACGKDERKNRRGMRLLRGQ